MEKSNCVCVGEGCNQYFWLGQRELKTTAKQKTMRSTNGWFKYPVYFTQRLQKAIIWQSCWRDWWSKRRCSSSSTASAVSWLQLDAICIIINNATSVVTLLQTALSREVMRSPPSARPSVYFHSVFGTYWPLNLNFCTPVGHDHSSHGNEGQSGQGHFHGSG